MNKMSSKTVMTPGVTIRKWGRQEFCSKEKALLWFEQNAEHFEIFRLSDTGQFIFAGEDNNFIIFANKRGEN